MPNCTANGIQIEYDTFGDSSSPPLLLIMALAGQMIFWNEEFCQGLADKGLFVIRFDNRDVGLSTKFEEADDPDLCGIKSKRTKTSFPKVFMVLIKKPRGANQMLTVGFMDMGVFLWLPIRSHFWDASYG